MKMCFGVHTHSTWCDGENTAEEMVLAAIKLGFTDLGFSSHSPTPFDESCPGVQDEAAYRAGIQRLRQAYRGRLNILCGMEQDFYAPVDKSQYDYIISSVHYLQPAMHGAMCIDNNPTMTRGILEGSFSGDALAMIKAYYALEVENAETYKPDVVGHFDLIAKHNRDSRWFDEEDVRYRRLALEALDAVLGQLRAYGGMLEVNTGAMARGLRDVPYPAPFLLRHAAQKKARVIITTDSHKTATLDAHYETAKQLLQQAGFASMAVLQGGVFRDILI